MYDKTRQDERKSSRDNDVRLIYAWQQHRGRERPIRIDSVNEWCDAVCNQERLEDHRERVLYEQIHSMDGRGGIVVVLGLQYGVFGRKTLDG